VRVTVVARCRLEDGLREYAEAKLGRVARHVAKLHELHLTVDGEGRRAPAYRAEVVAHLHHTQVAATVDAATQREAIDLVVDKVDRQLLRRKERVTDRKGRVPAGADPSSLRPRRAEGRGTSPPPLLP